MWESLVDSCNGLVRLLSRHERVEAALPAEEASANASGGGGCDQKATAKRQRS